MTDLTGTELLQQLKRHKPQSLKVVCRDGTDKPVAVPKAGNRWQRCMQTLDSLDWESIECLDKDGRVLGVIESPEDEAMLEELSGDDGKLHQLAKIMLEVMRSTQKETRQMFEVQMRGQAELVAALIDGVRSVSDSYSLAMKVQTSAAALSAGGDSDPEVMNMMKMAMALAMKPPAPPLRQSIGNPQKESP